jgi:flavin reductase (DIM6/NTAB) family NADH-FMN oxidoreductase RutF
MTEHTAAGAPGAAGTAGAPGPSPSPVSADAFKLAFRHHAAGVAVVSADVGDGPLALTASSVTSVSAEPPVLMLSVAGATRTGADLIRAGTLVVHLLGADQLPLAQRCADPTVDRFEDASTWERLPSGEPAFLGSRVRLRGRVIDRHVHGASTVLAVEVLEVSVADDAAERAPLAFHDRTWHRLDEGSRLA